MENRDNQKKPTNEKINSINDLIEEKSEEKSEEKKAEAQQKSADQTEKTDKSKLKLLKKKPALSSGQAAPKPKKKRKKWIYAVSIVALLPVVAIVAFNFLRPSDRTAQASYRRTTAQTGTITKTVVGTGNLTHGDTVDIIVPSGITIQKVQVSSGDSVEKGQILAEVDMATVQTTLADVQSQLDDLDDQINSTGSSSQSNVIKSNYSGRVKKIYAEKDKEANDIMIEHGALMLISIDGKMAVDFETTTSLSVGDSVSVKLSDGSTKSGTIISHSGNKYTATITDNGTDIDEAVTILKSGTTLGTGKLYINRPITVAGSGGTIEKIHVSENSKISVGTKLFTLEDSVDSIEYLELKTRREELMEQYNALVSMSKNGAVTAPQSGTISSVNVSAGTVGSTDSSSASESATQSTGAQSSQQNSSQSSTSSSGSSAESSSVTAFTLAADEEMTLEITIDEMDILSVAKDMEVSVTFDAIENQTYTGTINRVSGSSTGSSGSAKYTAEITLTADENMRAGMNATATITIEKKENILTIPVDAIQERGSRVFVYTQLTDGTPSGEVEITTGISDGQTAEVLSGLSEGQTVYYTAASTESTETGGFMFGGMGGMGGMQQGGDMNRGERPSDGNGGGAMPSGNPGGGQ